MEAPLSFKMTQWSCYCIGESVCYWLEKGNSMDTWRWRTTLIKSERCYWMTASLYRKYNTFSDRKSEQQHRTMTFAELPNHPLLLTMVRRCPLWESWLCLTKNPFDNAVKCAAILIEGNSTNTSYQNTLFARVQSGCFEIGFALRSKSLARQLWPWKNCLLLKKREATILEHTSWKRKVGK